VDANIHNWVDEFIDSTAPQGKDYDYMLCTHHRHTIVKYPEPYKKIYFDTNGINLKFILEDWYPSFCPTKTLLKQFEKLNLPDEYDVIHYSPCCLGERNKYSFEDFLKNYEWIWKDKKNVISTGKPMPGCVNLQKNAGIIKLYIMMKAKKIYTSLSGFTMIASMYRRRKESYLIDTHINYLNFGPPGACYTNVKLTGDLKPVFYYLENHPFEDYFNLCQTEKRIFWPPTPPHHGIFPDFEITKDESPPDYVPKKVYTDIENSPLPYNYKIEYNEIYD